MASVIRIKRRRADDPAEALLLSHKKSRYGAGDEPDPQQVESVLEFAGTLNSKDESISKQIKDAIRKKKIHKEMHPHSSEVTKIYDRSDVLSRMRKQKSESSHNKRYRITCNRRALDLDKLDNEKETKDSSTPLSDSEGRLQSLTLKGDDKENCTASGDAGHQNVQNDASVCCEGRLRGSEDETDPSFKSPKEICGSMCEHRKQDDKIYCLIDVEHEGDTSQSPASVITMNGVPMKTTSTVVPISEESDDYVYDVYFTRTRLGHMEEEAVLTVESLCNEFLYDEKTNHGDNDLVYDDDDDSNDEGNWRNDYPDEDPHFFENAEEDYDFDNDMGENMFDEGDMLSSWLRSGCKLDVGRDDFGDEEHKRHGSSSDEEAGDELGLY